MEVYLAAPIFTKPQLEVVHAIRGTILREFPDAHLFSPYHNSQEIFAGRKPQECTAEERARVLDDNIAYLDVCDLLFAWVGGMGGFTDPGVVWEMGYVHARKRNSGSFPYTIAYIDDTDARPSMNLMLAGTVDAVVRGHADMRNVFWHLGTGIVMDRITESFAPALILGDDMNPVV
jgi:nucleoside 2-deoxyribosyltransferase